jgi:hypothetical protein
MATYFISRWKLSVRQACRLTFQADIGRHGRVVLDEFVRNRRELLKPGNDHDQAATKFKVDFKPKSLNYRLEYLFRRIIATELMLSRITNNTMIPAEAAVWNSG